MYRIAQSLLMMATVAAASPADQASTVTLRDGNAFIESEAPASTDVINWTTAGIDHVSQQWYWYRVGADGSQGALDTLELQSQVLTDTDLDGHGDTLFLGYRDAGGAFRMSTRYVLNGGWAGFGISVLDERVTIENTLDEPLVFHIVGFYDRQLAGTVLDTSVQVVNGIQEVRTGGAITLHVTAITPSPSAVETHTNTTILHTLADLADHSFLGIVGPPEPYDPNWAFRWTVSLAPRGAFQISKVTRMASGDTTHAEDEIDCGCRGRLATLTLQYNGDRQAFIEVEQTKGGDIVFSGVIQPGERFSFIGTLRETLGSKIAIFVDTEPATVIPTKCSNSIGTGSIFGDFEVVDGTDKHGGTLCPID